MYHSFCCLEQFRAQTFLGPAQGFVVARRRRRRLPGLAKAIVIVWKGDPNTFVIPTKTPGKWRPREHADDVRILPLVQENTRMLAPDDMEEDKDEF